MMTVSLKDSNVLLVEDVTVTTKIDAVCVLLSVLTRVQDSCIFLSGSEVFKFCIMSVSS